MLSPVFDSNPWAYWIFQASAAMINCVQITKITLLLLFLSSVCTAQAKAIKPEWTTFSSPLKWESPPPELEMNIKSAPARIRVFFPSGEYGDVSCLLIRQGDGGVLISRGDGEVVRVGTWKQEGDHLLVTSRIVYRTVVIIGRPIPESETHERLFTTKEKEWTVWDAEQRYTPLPEFKDWGYLGALIQCDREYFDGNKHIKGLQPCMPQPDK